MRQSVNIIIVDVVKVLSICWIICVPVNDSECLVGVISSHDKVGPGVGAGLLPGARSKCSPPAFM